MSIKRKNLVGLKFGRLTVISFEKTNKNRNALWNCQCECGNIVIVRGDSLKNGHTLSCGCYFMETKITHGKSRIGNKVNPVYKAWQMMIQRCTNPNNKKYNNYGGRGISVSDRWLESFENFYADMGDKPSQEYSLDRYPNNETGNYELSNCRWGTDEQQRRNKRTNIWLFYAGKNMIMADWARELKINERNLRIYIKKKPFELIAAKYELKNQLNIINQKYQSEHLSQVNTQ